MAVDIKRLTKAVNAINGKLADPHPDNESWQQSTAQDGLAVAAYSGACHDAETFQKVIQSHEATIAEQAKRIEELEQQLADKPKAKHK